MKDVPENELLSAYLDGELTAEEQAEVEELLAASPAARQLVDELRALSSSLQALPAYQLGEDLSEQVLRLAEQGKLDRRAAAEAPNGAVEEPEEPAWRAAVRRLARPRNWVWAGVAVAVALLLMVTQSHRLFEPGRREIAMDTVGDDVPAAESPAAAPTEADEAADAETVAEYPAEAELAPRDEMKRGRADLADGMAGPGKAVSAPVPAAPAAAAPAGPPAVSGPAIAHPDEAAAPVERGGSAFGGMGSGRVDKESDAIEIQRPDRGMPSKDQARYAAKMEKGTAKLTEQEASTGAKADQPPADEQRPGPTLIVSCWGTPAALQGLAFEALLEKQGVRQVATAETEAEYARPRARAFQAGKAAWYGARGEPSALRQVVEVEATRDQL